MKRFTNLFFAIAALGLTSMVHAQEVLFEYTFDEGYDGWTAIPVSDSNAIWEWGIDPVTRGLLSAGFTVPSNSGGGAVIFDSDFNDNAGLEDNFENGASPAPQRAELLSPVMDFTDNAVVKIAFSQSYAYFAGPDENQDEPASRVEVSSDSGATWSVFFVNEDIASLTRTDGALVVDISAAAANQSEVMVKFVWHGNYYFWIVDDIQFFENVGVDLAIIEHTRANQFEAPQLLATGDSIDLEFQYENKGTSDSDSLIAIAAVFDSSSNRLFRDTVCLAGIAVGDTAYVDFANDFITTGLTPADRYLIIYSLQVKGDTTGELINPDDNVSGSRFNISESSLRFTPRRSASGFSGSARGLQEDFVFGNMFNYSAEAQENMILKTIDFDCFLPASAGDNLAPRSVIGYLVKFPDTSTVAGTDLLDPDGENPSNIEFDATLSIQDMIAQGWVTGIGNYAFTAADEASGRFSIPMFDLEDAESDVIIEPGYTYMLAVGYNGTANEIAQSVNENYTLHRLTCINYYPSVEQWTILNDLQTASIDASFQMDTTTVSNDDIELTEQEVSVFPNPATDFINVNIDLDATQPVSLFITDTKGSILDMQHFKAGNSIQHQFATSRYTAGMYILRVSTPDGVASRPFIVKH